MYQALLNDFLLYERNKSKESTYARYESIIRCHISPYFGELKLNELTSVKVELFTKEKLERGRVDKKRGVSPKRIRDILSVLKLSLAYATERGFPVNPIKIAFPRNDKTNIDILSVSEEEKVISYALNAHSQPKFGLVIALCTGIRIGELCALTWEDVDLDNNTLNINKTLQRIADRDHKGQTKVIIDSPKSNAGKRIIPLPSALVPYFILFLKLSTNDKSYVLTGTHRYIEPSNYYTMYQRWLQECNVPKHSFHALRHTFATRCIENGFDPKALSEILGHSDVKITLSRYVHPSIEFKRINMEKLSEIIISQKDCHS